ncbi:MAG: 2-oxoacid:acceptor oxidoreductase family protein [Gemmatimonadota bacterium]
MSVTAFYDRFERHAHGEGLKGHATHYCAGCGHGLAHKYMAEAIDELGIQDRTVAISPVGCSVFLYYYMDVGNSQAAHGRAPVVALGHKLANPESVVISYQGDGDLASIGLAETFHSAQIGLPISVIFINNAIYGMTGGQMAPTTLMGQQTTTTPSGRGRMAGMPFRVSELIGQLDGPIYVERVALFGAKQRVKAKKAIKKAIRLQVENKGFSFVEVLSECPTHLKMTPLEAEKWVEESMVPIFPLGVKKDISEEITPEMEFAPFTPTYQVDRVKELILEGSSKKAGRFAEEFPAHIARDDISLKLAGAGGDGAQTAALLLTRMAINEGLDSTHIPSYGPESRGGTSYADVHIARDEVLSPGSPKPNILIAFNAPSLAKFGPAVAPEGYIIYDSSVISEPPSLNGKVKMYGVPFTEIATNIGRRVIKNVVALGALQAVTEIFPQETFLEAVRQALADKCAMIPMNEEAFQWGRKAVLEMMEQG